MQKYRGSLFALRRAYAEVVLAALKQHPFVFSYRVRFVGNTGTSPHGESSPGPATRFPASSTRPETDNLVKRVFGKYPLGGLGKLEHKPPSSAGFMGKLPCRQRHPKQAPRDARKQHGRCDSPCWAAVCLLSDQAVYPCILCQPKSQASLAQSRRKTDGEVVCMASHSADQRPQVSRLCVLNMNGGQQQGRKREGSVPDETGPENCPADQNPTFAPPLSRGSVIQTRSRQDGWRCSDMKCREKHRDRGSTSKLWQPG